MVHVLPGLQDDIRSLLLGAIREGLNTVVQNFGATSLYIDRGKAAQIGPYRRHQGMPSFSRVTEPVCPLLKHSLLNPVKFPVADEVNFEVSWWRERNGQCRQRKLRIPRRQKQSQCQITTGRIAGNNQTVRIGAVFQQPAVGIERSLQAAPGIDVPVRDGNRGQTFWISPPE